jgi:hypothetical protein
VTNGHNVELWRCRIPSCLPNKPFQLSPGGGRTRTPASGAPQDLSAGYPGRYHIANQGSAPVVMGSAQTENCLTPVSVG